MNCQNCKQEMARMWPIGRGRSLLKCPSCSEVVTASGSDIEEVIQHGTAHNTGQ